jgi:3-dehydroquinate synthase
MTAEDVVRVERLIARTGLPTHIDAVSPETAHEFMRIDKKVQSGRIRLILLRKIGEVFITADYPESALERTLREYFGPARG